MKIQIRSILISWKAFQLPKVLILTALLSSCANEHPEVYQLFSPDRNIKVEFTALKEGELSYAVYFKNKEVIKPSRLGYLLKDGQHLDENFTVTNMTASSSDSTWEQPWGEQRFIRNQFNQYVFNLNSENKKLNIAFKLFNDGIAFRYEIPKQEKIDSINIINELTEFAFNNDHSAWWIPAYQNDRYEYLYQKSYLSQLDVVHTPLTIELIDSLYISIHEAALTDYASMVIRNEGSNKLHAELVPWADGVLVKGKAPLRSSWRTIQIVNEAKDLANSNIILNLNEPNKLGDVSWVKPAKYVGIWWAMHIDKYTWGSGPKHGATTENVKRYMDFASENGFSGVLVEGWNEGWDGDWASNLDAFNFTKPYPDFEIEEITNYGKSKNVSLIGHHETSAGVANYEKQLEDAFKFYSAHGVTTIKTGYVGSRLNGTEWHHGQFGVRHYRKVIETAAKYKIMLDVHEPIKDTGMRRTYPNMMSREGARGMEFDAWAADGGNPPEHGAILPFTRLLAGPMDFTPGIFELSIASKENNKVNTTLAKQLAFYVVIYSPLHMAADLPENYEGQPAFQFIKDVPVDWEKSIVLNGEIGEYITTVRKDRNSDNWFMGALTNEDGRELNVSLSFLDPQKKYQATIYKDAPNAHWDTNPQAYEIEQLVLGQKDNMKIKLAPGGGTAVSLVAID